MCRKGSRAHYDNLFVQIVNKLNSSLLVKETRTNDLKLSLNNDNKKKCKPMNVMLISYDSVSRSSWFKRIPKATKYALETMKFELLTGYNIVGDGTPGN